MELVTIITFANAEILTASSGILTQATLPDMQRRTFTLLLVVVVMVVAVAVVVLVFSNELDTSILLYTLYISICNYVSQVLRVDRPNIDAAETLINYEFIQYYSF